MPRWVRPAVVFVAGMLTAWLVSRPLVAQSWGSAKTLVWIGGALALLALVWLALAARAEKLPGPALPLALAGLSASVAVVLGTSGTALLAQTVGGVAVAMGLVTLLAARRAAHALPIGPTGPAVVGPVVVLLGGLLFAGVLYAEVQVVSAVLLVAGALVVGLAPLPGSSAGGWKAAVSAAAVVLVTAGAAVATTLLAGGDDATPSAADTTAPDDDYGYED